MGGQSGDDAAAVSVNRALIIALVVAALYLGRDVFIPLALALLLSVALMPVTDGLRRIGVPRVPAVLLVLLLAIGVISGLVLLLASQILSLAAALPDYEATFRAKLQALASGQGSFERLAGMLQRLEQAVAAREAAEPPTVVVASPSGSAPLANVLAVGGAVLGPVVTVAIALLLMAFLLVSRADVRDRFLRLAGTRDLYRTTRALGDATERVGRYLLMQVVVNASFGIGMGAGLWLIGLPNAPLWGLLGFVLRFVPFLGAPLSVLFPLLIAFATTDGWGAVLLVLALFAVVDIVCTYVMEPLLYGRSTGISPLALVLSAALWAVLWGPIGLILAPPITACLVILGRHVPGLAYLEVMFGDRAVLPAPVRFYQRLLADDPVGAEEIADALLHQDGARAMLETLVLPALDSVREDRREGVLDAASATRIARALATLVRELTDETDDAATGEAALRVLVAPAAGALDVAAAEVLAALLRGQGHAATTAAAEGVRLDLAVLAMQDQAGSARLRRAIAAAGLRAPAVLTVSLAGSVAPPALAGIDAMLAEVERLARAQAAGNPVPAPRVQLVETGTTGSLSKGPTMSSTTDKMKGVANEIAGKVKQGVGRTFDAPQTEAEGVVQERKGEAQQAKGEAKEQVKKVIDKA
jgi:predicted PurR-regulated permease PerM/uncharacterized protein YjbJ (UPF0337 family)